MSSFRLSNGHTLRTSAVFDLYWRFAQERQSIFLKRVEGFPPPWTNDSILQNYRFTNPYRASDRVSQFLIRDVIYNGRSTGEEIFFRILLFKLFNRIETWNLLQERLGPVSWKKFNFDAYNHVLDESISQGQTVYSPAYIMPCPPFGAARKHSNHLSLLAKMMRAKVCRQIEAAESLKQVVMILRSIPSIGNFLAFQLAIDLNYSEWINFSEMDFVLAGPGARSGIRKCFLDYGGLSEDELIQEVTLAADQEFETRGLRFETLWGRPLQLIDCQNLFCEID
jgi:hypothetical protein